MLSPSLARPRNHLVLGSWFLVLSPRSLVLGSWPLVLGTWLLVLCFGQQAAAADRPADIQRAIDRGVAFLRSIQDPKDGMWHYGADQEHPGPPGLAGLTFLECGVPANEPQVQQA